MAYRIKANGGACCPCAERVGCDCGAPCATIECRTRGGMAAMFGLSQYVPTLPPRKYLKEAASGTATANVYGNSSCTGSPIQVASCTLSGSSIYDRITGVFSTTAAQNCGSGPITLPPGPFAATCGRSVVNTATTSAANPIPTDCCGSTKATADGYLKTLSDEYTEADAISALLAGVGGTWSGWQDVGVCIATTCCRASWAARGSGQFSFAYQESEYRVTSTGHPPGWSVTLKVRFFRKASSAPDSAYVFFAEESQAVDADGSGIATATGAVPLTQGYDTYVASCGAVAS